MTEEALSGYLGLAMKSGSLSLGAAETAAQAARGRVALAFLDVSAAENTVRRVGACCQAAGISLLRLRPGLLGTAVGRPGLLVAGLRQGPIATRLLRTPPADAGST